MHLGALLSTQEARDALDSYASFVLSSLPRASITPWLHAARLPFLNWKMYVASETCLLIAEADRVLCHYVLTVFFALDLLNEIQLL